MYTPKKVLGMFATAKRVRHKLEDRFDQAMRYSMPGRGAFFRSDPSRDIDNIFDETAIVGTQEFASRLQSGITPNFSRWAELKAGSDIPEEDRDEVNEELQKVTAYAFDILNYSNFATESYESYLDLAVTFGCLEVEQGTSVEPVRFAAVPINELWINVGPYDRIDQFFRLRSYTWEQLNVKYPNNKFPVDERQKFMESGKPEKFLEATFRDWSNPEDEVHHRKIIWMRGDKDSFVFEREYRGVGSCPMIGYRWGKEAGSVWGRGPLMNALPAIKTCNLVVQMVLENAQMSIAGLYNMDDDSTVNPDTIELVPGTIIPRTPGTRGLEAVQPAGNFNVADLVLDDMRTNIKKALYNDMLGSPERTPMSATEVAERMADLSRQIGSAFGRLMFEMVVPVLQRTVFILKARGLIELPTINGKEVKVTATSPLAQAQNQKDIQSVDRLVEWVSVRFGPQLANIFIKGEAASEYVADKLQVPKELVRTEKEMQQLLGRAMEVAQGQPDAANPQGEAGVAAPSAAAGGVIA